MSDPTADDETSLDVSDRDAEQLLSAAIESEADDQGHSETGPDSVGEPRPHSEAARYRVRARAAEQRAESLAEQVAVLQRAAAERVAGEHLLSPGDMWAVGISLDELLGPDGNLDPAKVTQRATELAAERPHWRRRSTPPAKPRAALSGGGDPTDDAPSSPTWTAVLGRRE